MKYRKKPIVIEAIQWNGSYDSGIEIIEWSGGLVAWSRDEDTLDVLTLEGVMRASNGDWIIKGVAEEFYPCKPNIFDATYEPVSEQ